MLHRRLLLEWWAIFAFAALMAAIAATSGWTQRLDNLLLDQAIPLAAAPPSDQILIVEIDEQSLSAIGSWPWKRSVHADLITRITAAAPRAIGYDVLFIEPGNADDDQLLVTAVAASGRVTLPLQYQVPGSNGQPMDVYRPFAPLPSVAASVGQVGLRFDPDGLVRRVDLKGRDAQAPFFHLMEQTLRVAAKGHARTPGKATRSGETLLPLHPRSSFRTIPAASILQGQVLPDFMKGKFVLVGASAQGMADIFPVSAAAGSTMPGVEIQANLLNGLLANQFVVEAGPVAAMAVAIIAITLLMLAFWRFSPRVNLALSLALLTGLVVGSLSATIVGGYWIAPGPAVLAILLLYPLWGWRRLAALDDFVSSEAIRLSGGARVASAAIDAAGFDSIARQAMQLRSVIGEITDRQKFMNGVIGAAPDAICVIDQSRQILLANTAAEKLFGTQLVGCRLPAVMGIDDDILPTDGTEWTAPDGRVLLITKSDMALHSDQMSGTIFCLSDISAIREAERERREMLEFLSHDMRSPQAAIVSLVDGQPRGVSDPSDLMARIRKHAIQTLKLTDDFVQLARLTAIDPVRSELNLADLVREAIDENYVQARSKSIKLRCDDADDVHFVLVDGAAVTRALSNLIGNAIKYSPESSAIECRIWSTFPGDSAATVWCSIADQGPGLPPARRADPFGRFGYRDEHQAFGAGLGLAFVKSAIDRNLGKIILSPTVETGTCFLISFDLAG